MNEDEIISRSILDSQNEEKLSPEEIAAKKDKIKKEKNRLNKLFKEIDKTTRTLVQNLIEEVAFMSITLEENRKHLEENGVKELYMNGKGQFGYKESVESKNYNVMFKNYSNAVKQLVDLLPKEDKKNAGENLLNFIASGKK